jgi:hypothetical protein
MKEFEMNELPEEKKNMCERVEVKHFSIWDSPRTIFWRWLDSLFIRSIRTAQPAYLKGQSILV